MLARSERALAVSRGAIPGLRCLSVLLAALSLLAAAASAYAAPSWHAAQLIGTPVKGNPLVSGGNPQVAGAPDGTAVAAWRQAEVPSPPGLAYVNGCCSRVQAAIRPPGGRFGRAQWASPSGRKISAFRVAALPGGGALAVWTDPDDRSGVSLAVAPPGGRFGAPRKLVGANEKVENLDDFQLGLATDATGDALIAWVDDGGVFTATRSASGELTAPKQLGPNVGGSSGLAVAVAPRGDAVVAWVMPDGDSSGCGGTSVVASTRPAGGSFAAPVTLDSVCEGHLGVVDAAIDSSGDAIVLWRETPGGDYVFMGEIRAATRAGGGSFSAKQTLGSASLSSTADTSFARDGSALLLWHRSTEAREEGAVGYGILAARARPGSGFASARRVASAADQSGAPSLARDPDGSALAAWVENGGVRGAVERRSGSFCAQTVSPPPRDPSLLGPFTYEPPDIAAGRSGEAIAVWHRFNRFEAAIGTADGKAPVLRRLSGHSRRRGRRRVARVSFRLSEAARVRIRLARRVGGRYRRVLTLVRSLPAGRSKLTLARRRGRSLRRGSYRASARAGDCDGRHSKTRRTKFSVRRG